MTQLHIVYNTRFLFVQLSVDQDKGKMRSFVEDLAYLQGKLNLVAMLLIFEYLLSLSTAVCMTRIPFPTHEIQPAPPTTMSLFTPPSNP